MICTQKTLQLGLGVVTKPADAPHKVVAQVESEAQALCVMVRAKGLKLDYVAAAIGKSRPYLSLMLSGKRPIPHKLVGPLCAATGSNLLAQFIALQIALEPEGEVERLAALLRAA
jgi:hypothetical protein